MCNDICSLLLPLNRRSLAVFVYSDCSVWTSTDWTNNRLNRTNKLVCILSVTVIPQKCRKMLFYGFAWLLGHLCCCGLEQTSGLSRFYHHVSNPEGQEIKVTWCAAMLKWTCLIWERWDQAWLRDHLWEMGPLDTITTSEDLHVLLTGWKQTTFTRRTSI